MKLFFGIVREQKEDMPVHNIILQGVIMMELELRRT